VVETSLAWQRPAWHGTEAVWPAYHCSDDVCSREEVTEVYTAAKTNITLVTSAVCNATTASTDETTASGVPTYRH